MSENPPKVSVQQRVSNDGVNSIRREQVDVDPLASFLSPHAMPNQIIAPQSVQYSTHQQRKSSDAPLQFPPPPPIVPKPRTDAAFFADKFFEECRVNPLDYRNCVPSNLVGMRMCAKSRCWKHVIDISSSILDGKSGLEYIVTSNKLNDGSSKKLVLSPVLSLRLEGLFRLQMFDEVIEEIHNTITSATSLLSPESLSTAGATASTRTSTFGGNVNMGLLSNPKYASVLSMTDFNTQMILNMLLIEVRLLTGRSEDALQELYAIREQVYVDVDSVANASVEMSPPEVQLCLEKFYWFWTVSCTILSTICRQRQWRLAVTEFTKMITEIQKLSNIISFNKDMSTNRNDLSALTTLHNNIILAEITIRCRLCRLLCQMGAIHPATNCLLAVIETVQENSSIVELDTIINSPKENIQLFVKSAMENEGCEVFRTNPLYKAGLASICVSAGLIFYCLNEYEVASNCFQFVISREKQSGISKLFSTTDVNDMSSAADVFYQSPTSTVDNMNASNAVYPSVTNSLITFNDKNKLQFGLVEVCSNNIYNKMCDDGFGSHQEICYANNANESILATAINNYAICSLHLKNIKEAVSVLEDLIKDNPTIYLIDPIVFNLCTMYDLIYASDISVQRKKTIQIIATYYDIEDPMLHWRCYRLANNS